MRKSEIRVVILLMVISLTAVWFSVLIPTSEPWTVAVLAGIAILATVFMLVVLWKAILRSRAKDGRER
jgi:hypothetical protein